MKNNPEKHTGQLFCDGKSQEIIDMLVRECHKNNVKINLETAVDKVSKNDE